MEPSAAMRVAMRIGLVVLLAVVGAAAFVWSQLLPPTPPAPAATEFTLPDVTVVNPGLERREHQAVRVRRGVISAIAPEGDANSGAEILRTYAGAFVLPGLIDLHVHLPPDNALKLTGHACLLYLRHGVTSVRDAGDVDGTAVPAAEQGIAEGLFPGPRIFACGPFVAGEMRWANTVLLDNPQQADAVVARIKAAGFDCVKSYDKLNPEIIKALVEAGKRHGLPVIGHVPYGIAYEDALVPEVQHLHGIPRPESVARDHFLNRGSDWQDVDDARMVEIVRTSLAHGIVNTPTLIAAHQVALYEDYQRAQSEPIVRLMPRLYRDVVWSPIEGLPTFRDIPATFYPQLREALDKKHRLVKRLYDAGAELRLGSDVQNPFLVPGASLHQEMAIFRDLGIPLEQVWAIATWKAGRTLGVPQLGSLADGAPADMLIFRRDPTADLDALSTLEAVVVRGQLYTRADLDDAVAAWQRHFDNDVFDWISVSAARRILSNAVKSQDD